MQELNNSLQDPFPIKDETVFSFQQETANNENDDSELGVLLLQKNFSGEDVIIVECASKYRFCIIVN